MIKLIRHVAAFLLTAMPLLVAGCGGGGGGGGSAAPVDTVTGVAAVGAAIANGKVYLRDSAATPYASAPVATSATGAFAVDVTGKTPPFMLKVVSSDNSTTLYSLAGSKGIANINPMSNLVVAKAASAAGLPADLSSIYDASTALTLNGIASNLTKAVADVQAILKAVLNANVDAVNPITDVFTLNAGLDLMLDSVKIEVASSGVATITKTGSAPQTLNLATDFRTFAVSGKVTLAGAPLAGVTVSVADASTGIVDYGSAVTGADGSYALASVPVGSYKVSAYKAGYALDRLSSTLNVGADSIVPDFTASAVPVAFTISGRISGANAGLAGVTVTASRAGAASRTAVTDGNGDYAIGGLSNGDYVVTPSRADVYASKQVAFGPASQPTTVKNDYAVQHANFSAASVATFSVSGKVTDSTGAAMAGVKVALATELFTGALAAYAGAALTAGEASFSSFTDADGNYSISGIPTGYYTLAPSRAGSAFGALDVVLLNRDKGVDFIGVPEATGTGGIIINF